MGTREAEAKVGFSLSTLIKNILTDTTYGRASTSAGINDIEFETGNGEGQVDRVWWMKNKTLSAGTSITIDLNDFAGLDIGAGAGLDALGQALDDAAEIKGFIVHVPKTTSPTVSGILAFGPNTPGNNGLHTNNIDISSTKFFSDNSDVNLAPSGNERIQLQSSYSSDALFCWLCEANGTAAPIDANDNSLVMEEVTTVLDVTFSVYILLATT